MTIIFSGCGSSKSSDEPAKVVELYLTAASFGDTDTMKTLTVGTEKKRVEENEIALKKLVFFERSGMYEELEKEIIIYQGSKNSENEKKPTKKIGKGNFDFNFHIMKEETEITPGQLARISVLLTRRSKSVTRIFELEWSGKRWLISQSYNKKR